MQSVPCCTAFTVYMHSVVLPPNYPQFSASTQGRAWPSCLQAVSSLCIYMISMVETVGTPEFLA